MIKALFILFLSLCSLHATAQQQDSVEMLYGPITIPDVYVVSGIKTSRLFRDRSRLERIIAKVYPIAKEANSTLRMMERELMSIKGDKRQREYIKSVEKAVKKKYTPILKRMTTSEGLILLKLIDRETGNTTYQLVKEMRGGFSAFFWQGVASFFSVSLKSEYDAKGEDRLIEYYIQKYEQGL